MAKKEKFGKFVLLEEVENVGIGHEYRAAKLGTTGLEKIVSVLRLKPPLASNAEAVKSLMDQVKFAAQLQNPNVLKIYGIGKVDTAYYISYEFLEGKSLRPIFEGKERPGHEALFWEHEGNRAVRQGQWKLVAVHGGAWELYDLEADRTERHDLAAKMPDKVKELAAQYERWAGRVGVVPWDKLNHTKGTPK